MTAIPLVWKKDGQSPPEWVLLEMQGELQFKEHMQRKGGGPNFSSTLQSFEGLEMGVLAPHTEHGPTRPELRIGNLVIQGKLVPLSKPLLVLCTQRLPAGAAAASEESTSSAVASPARASTKRPRSPDAAGSATAADSSAKKACLQTVAVIRHKYLFNGRPYAICDMGTPAVTASTAATHAPAKAT